MRRLVACVFLLGLAVWARVPDVKPYLRIETGTHTAEVALLDVDAAQQFLVSASYDKTARVWDLRSGKLLKVLRPPIGDGDEGKLYAVAISPDGKSIAVGGLTAAEVSDDFPIYIFDRESGSIRKTVTGLPDAINYLAYSQDGRYLAAAGEDLRIYETERYTAIFRDERYGDQSYWVDFDKSGKLVTTSDDGFVRLYGPDFHLLKKVKASGGQDPLSARFSPDGGLIAVGFNDSTTVEVVSASDLSFRYNLVPSSGGDDYLGVVAWSANGRTLCAAGGYNTNEMHPMLCWGDGGEKKMRTFPLAGETIMDIRALHDGGMVFAVGDGTVGVLGPNGVARWRAAPEILDYRSEGVSPRISSDGTTVETIANFLEGNEWVSHTLRFSVPACKLEIDAKPDSRLVSPVSSGLAIGGWRNSNSPPTLDGRTLPLERYESSRSVAIAPSQDSFVLGSDWHIYKFDGQGKEVWSILVPEIAWGVNVSSDRRFVVAALGDGTVRWYTFTKGEEVLALFVDRDLKRWVAWNPDGFFTFDGGGDGLIGYQINRGPGQAGEFVKVDQLREVFYRPDLIAQVLKPGGAEAVLAAGNRIGDISKVLASGLPPEIELISPPQAEVDGDYVLQFRVKDMGGGSGRFVYLMDGVEIGGRGAFDIAGTGGNNNTIVRSIPVGSGEHKLTVAATNTNGTIIGSSRTILLKGRTAAALSSNLYIVAAGISHYSDPSLNDGVKFAASDADLVTAKFKEQEGKGLYQKVNLNTIPLLDSKATVKNIGDAVAKAAGAVQPGDTFILYLAGHGVAVDGEYYFIPWVEKYENQHDLLAKSLNREAIQGLLKQVHTSKSVLILDTCGAGAVLGSGDVDQEKAAISRVAVTSPHTVLAASSSEKAAMEGYENHGVFTYELIQGMKAADSDTQGEILITRLGEYVQKWVPQITDQRWHYRQTPVTMYPTEPFPIAQKVPN